MTRRILLAVIGLELAVGGLLAWLRLREATPPAVDASIFDPVTAAELRDTAVGLGTPEQWANLGDLYLAHGYFREAEVCVRVASQRRPEDLDLAFRHGFALERIGRLDEAIGEYRRATDGIQNSDETWKHHERTAEIWYYSARNLIRLERPIAAQRDAFGHSGSVPATTYENSRRWICEGNLDAAGETARNLAAAHPSAFQPVSLLYRIAVARGDRAQAARLADHFGRQIGSLPMPFDQDFKRLNDLRDGFGLGKRKKELDRLIAAGKGGEAEKLAGEILAAEWTPTTVDQWAEAGFLRGQPRDAIARIDEAIARAGPAWPILERLGDAYKEAGDATKARAAWERAAALGTGPELKNLRHKLALAYEQAGQKDAANSYHALAALSAGVEAFEAARPPDAIAAFTEATQLNPRLTHAWFYLGECHRLTGRPVEARTAYEKCLQLDPNHGRAIRATQLLPK